MYINLLYLPLFNFAYLFSFFSFLSMYLLVLSSFHSPLCTLLQFCFPVCVLVSFVLIDIIFGFLCLPGQSIVLYFCWTVSILLMGVFVYTVTRFFVVINLCLCVGLLQFCGVFLIFFFFPFFFLPFLFFLFSFL